MYIATPPVKAGFEFLTKIRIFPSQVCSLKKKKKKREPKKHCTVYISLISLLYFQLLEG